MAVISETLALLGGEPVYSEQQKHPAWPQPDPQTADRLRDFYLGGKWSFHSRPEAEFADDFAAHHDSRYGIFMVNGTVTLQAALTALGIGPGDEVIVPALTWFATGMAVHYVGATPVYVDVDPETLCLDPKAVEAQITARTAAVIPVHIYGSMADLQALTALAQRHNLAVVEDCAHMHGGKWDGRGVGGWGDVGSFSFQKSKTLSSGEGGMCLTNDEHLADRIFRIKHIGYSKGSQQGQIDAGPPEGMMCHNFRATGFQAIVAQGQLPGLEDRLVHYNHNRDLIEQAISQVEGFRLQARGRKATLQGYYGAVLIADQGQLAEIPQSTLIDALTAEGMKPGPTYGPVYQHPFYNMPSNTYRIAEGRCQIAEQTGTDRALVLGHPWLGVDSQTAQTIGEIFAKVAANAQMLKDMKSSP